MPVATPGHKWPVVTSEGTFEETDLAPAHPTVLATASGRDLARDAFRADMDFRRARAGEGLPPELRDEVEEVLKEAKLDLSGHWKDGEAIDGFKILEHLFVGPNAMSKADAEDVVRAAKAKTIMDWWAPVGLHLSVRTCSFCGEDGFKLETNGLVVRVVGDWCKYADGLPPTEWELNVPSGRLAVANDLRGVFPLPEDERASGGGSSIVPVLVPPFRSVEQVVAASGVRDARVDAVAGRVSIPFPAGGDSAGAFMTRLLLSLKVEG